MEHMSGDSITIGISLFDFWNPFYCDDHILTPDINPPATTDGYLGILGGEQLSFDPNLLTDGKITLNSWSNPCSKLIQIFSRQVIWEQYECFYIY